MKASRLVHEGVSPKCIRYGLFLVSEDANKTTLLIRVDIEIDIEIEIAIVIDIDIDIAFVNLKSSQYRISLP